MNLQFKATKIITSLLSYSLLYFSLILALGYEYGTGDLIEIEPYWDALFHPEKWQNDFFVSAQLQRVPNERYLFVRILALTGPPNPWVALAGHYLCTIILIAGLDRLAMIWIPRADLRVLTILLICIGLYGINTGGNELYYPFLTNSYAAQTVGVWAIWFLVNKRIWGTTASLIAISYLHILIGLQLSLLCFGAVILHLMVKKDSSWNIKQVLLGILVWITLVVPYLLLLLGQVAGSKIASDVHLDIMEFRLPHHFFPAYFPIRSWLITSSLVIAGLFFYLKKCRTLFYLGALTVIGCIFYTLGIYAIGSTTILSSQWFESTIWIEAMATIALVAILQDRVPEIKSLSKTALPTALIIAALVLFTASSPIPIFKSRTLGEPIGTGPADEIDISKLVRENISKDAIFALPPDVTGFKWYAQRASYVDYKSMLHHNEMLKEWYKRINWLYGIGIKDRRAGNDLYALADKNLAERLTSNPESLRHAGITHVLLPKGLLIGKKPVLENRSFEVYQLD